MDGIPVVTVMADYACFPLWRCNASGTTNTNPLALPISAGLAQDLLRWADVFDRTLNRRDPAASGFPGPSAEDDFHGEGLRLAERLAEELAGRYAVEYFDGRDGRTCQVVKAIQLHDLVELLVEPPDCGLTVGSIGTVMHVFHDPKLAYEVEFADDKGRPVAMVSLTPDQVRLRS